MWTQFILQFFAELAEKERAMIATRAKDALAKAKFRGVKLVDPKLAPTRKTATKVITDSVDHHAATVLPVIRAIQKADTMSLRAVADSLNSRHPTA